MFAAPSTAVPATALPNTALPNTVVPPTALPSPKPTAADIEFDRQVDALIQAGVPGLLDAREDCFRAMVDPLRDLLPLTDDGAGGIPFVVAVPHVSVADLLPAVHNAGGAGRTGLAPRELAEMRAVPELGLPRTPYLVIGVDPGSGTRDVPPAEAAARIAAEGRSPLTVEEGLALLVSDCGLLRAGTCFALLGSRSEPRGAADGGTYGGTDGGTGSAPGDDTYGSTDPGTDGAGRVAALWTSGQRPTLGWWDASRPHPGLGSASCRQRLWA